MRNAIVTLACAALLLACQTSGTEQTEIADEPTGAAQDQGLVERSVPVQAVTSVGGRKTSPGAMDYTSEMQGAKPGEVRGFMSHDGSKAWAFKPDGKITMRQLAELVFNNKESLNISPAEIEKVAITLAKQNGMPPDPDSTPAPNQVVVCELKYFARLVKKAGASRPLIGPTPDGGTNMSPGSKKALGYTAPASSGLDID